MLKSRLILTLLWSLVILVIIGLPGSYFPKTPHFIDLFSPDKLIHIILFAPLSILILSTFYSKNTPQLLKKRSFLFLNCFGTVFGFMTELLQVYFFIGRDGNVYDAIADTFGIWVGFGIFLIIKKKYPRLFHR